MSEDLGEPLYSIKVEEQFWRRLPWSTAKQRAIDLLNSGVVVSVGFDGHAPRPAPPRIEVHDPPAPPPRVDPPKTPPPPPPAPKRKRVTKPKPEAEVAKHPRTGVGAWIRELGEPYAHSVTDVAKAFPEIETKQLIDRIYQGRHAILVERGGSWTRREIKPGQVEYRWSAGSAKPAGNPPG